MELTKNETEIVDLLWKENRPLTSVEIVEKSTEKSWKSSSIHILLNSLLKKGAIKEVGFVRSGKGYARTFEPSETAEEYYAGILEDIVGKVHVPSLFMALVDSEKISMDTVEELEEMIKRRKKGIK